jgi:hypothetical protein
MPAKSTFPAFSLPRTWHSQVKSAVLQAISLAHYALTYSRSWAADCRSERVRRKAEASRLTDEASLLDEELQIHNV